MHGTTSEEIIRKADQAMYAAKAAGRNLVITAE
jgi:GGDEF domain-containing protein